MSAIAKDASITLITATPGSGKTLRLVWYIQQALKAGEQVFVCNLNGLSTEGDFAGWVDFPDPTKWRELPPGSILIVDEAQRFFRAQTSGTAPEYIRDMETIRHDGIRLILITQHPGLIHGNIRALVGRHEHMLRKNGAQHATVYVSSRVMDNVRADRTLAKEDHHVWHYPTELFGAYKSAEVHTVKRTIPSKWKRAGVMAAVALALVGYVVWSMKGKVERPEAALATVAAPAATVPASAQGVAPGIRSAADYAEQYTPLVAAMPWTMPATVNREAVAQPSLYCMSSGQGRDGSGRHGRGGCTCLTEQGTRYEIADDQCRDIARHGTPYNPQRAPQLAQVAPMMPAAPAAAPIAAPVPRVALAVGDARASAPMAYGDLRP